MSMRDLPGHRLYLMVLFVLVLVGAASACSSSADDEASNASDAASSEESGDAGADDSGGESANERGGTGALLTGQPIQVGRSIIATRSEEHTSELQSLMRISYAVFCLKKKTNTSQ